MTILSHILVPQSVVVACAIVAAVVLSPGRAAAECGDYVHIATAQSPSGSAPQNPPHQPCTGPGCSDRPTAPLVPPAAPVTGPSESQEWAMALPGDADRGGDRGWAIPSTLASLPVHFPDSIFHPPRG